MIKLKTLTGVLLTALVLGAAPAMAKDVVTMVHPTDPIFEASVWPIQHGKVTSDKVDLKVSFTSIRAVIHAVGTKQYDLIPMVTNILPKLVARGLPVKIIATNQRYTLNSAGSRLFVRADSKIKTIADLKGKTIGVTSLRSSGVTSVRVTMAELYHVNVASEGGDYKWVEMPLAVLPAALKSGRIDAAILSNQYAYQASRNKDFRLLLNKSMNDAVHAQVPGTVILGYADKLAARPADFVEAARMLKASADYVAAHQDEVFGAVAKQNDIDPAYLKWYYANYASIPYDLTKGDLKGIEAFWGALKRMHMLKKTPPVQSMVWNRIKIE